MLQHPAGRENSAELCSQALAELTTARRISFGIRSFFRRRRRMRFAAISTVGAFGAIRNCG